VLLVVLVVVVSALVYYSSLIAYGLKQLQGQLTLMWSAVHVDEALYTSKLDRQEKNKVLLIQDVRVWADTALGLHVGDNYTKFVRQDSNFTMWVVTAAYPYALKSYQWHYGPLGEMAYKGFFDRKLAEQEAERIKGLGFDTDIGIAGGWSTLGILDDPILSGMLKRDSASLIELIIHESTHATVFHWGKTRWNENIATTIGRAGMEQYLKEVLQDTLMLEAYQKRLDQRTKNRVFIHERAMLLSNHYQDWEEQQLDDSIRAQRKTKLMEVFKQEFLSFSGKKEWPERWKLNNTFFTDYLNYHASNDSLRLVLDQEYQGDIKAFTKSLK